MSFFHDDFKRNVLLEISNVVHPHLYPLSEREEITIRMHIKQYILKFLLLLGEG